MFEELRSHWKIFTDLFIESTLGAKTTESRTEMGQKPL
jgi:hypothetical protein